MYSHTEIKHFLNLKYQGLLLLRYFSRVALASTVGAALVNTGTLISYTLVTHSFLQQSYIFTLNS